MSKSRFLTEYDEIYSAEKARALVSYGDIKTDDDLSNQTVKELLKKILQPYRKPDNISCSFTTIKNGNSIGIENIYEKSQLLSNSIDNIVINFNYKYWSNLIQNYIIKVGDNSYTYSNNGTEKDGYKIYHTEKLENISISNNGNYTDDNSITISVTGNDGKTSGISIGTKEIKYIRPYFLFVVDTNNDLNFNFETKLVKIINSMDNSDFFSNIINKWITDEINGISSKRILSTLKVNNTINFADTFSNKGSTSKIMIVGIPSNLVKNGNFILLNSTKNDVEFSPINETITGKNGVTYKLYRSLETKFDNITYTVKTLS